MSRPRSLRLPPRSVTLCGGLLAMIVACGGNPPAADTGAAAGADAPAADTAESAAPAEAGMVATLRAVSGPAGVRTSELEKGIFLGKGAALPGGARLLIPAGTLAELELVDGGILRFNENSEVVLPTAGSRELEVVDGETVALITGDQRPLTIIAADDRFTVDQGEARVLQRSGSGAYAVVYGAARLDHGGRSIDLGPGATVDTPLAAASPAQPVVSLRPLEETAWARSFEEAAALASAVPAGVGALTARRAGERFDRYSLRLVDQRVNVTISGRIAHTEIEQTFYNEAPMVLEGTYRFPLPADATIAGLSLLVGNRWEEAAMLEKSRAARIFKQIVEATVPRDPALLQWERGNLFSLKIFPIPGRGERKVRLRYTQVLPTVGDHLRYRYPLSGSGATGTAIGSFSFAIDLDRDGLPAEALTALRTPMADLERRDAGDRITLSTVAENFRPVHDLGVDIPLPAASRRLHAETHLDRDGQAYFMVAVEPRLPVDGDRRATDYAFVIDRSHSMTPELWTVARGLVTAMAGGFSDDDRLTVLACDTACDAVPGGLMAPQEASFAAIDAFLGGQTLAGASDLGGMLRAAAVAVAGDPGKGVGGGENRERERVIVYLGDGNASAGELAPDGIFRHLAPALGSTPVHAVALGARSDLLVLGALTERTGGDLIQADPKDDLRELVRTLRLRAAIPKIREVALDLPEGMVHVHPTSLHSLRAGDPLVLVGKLAGPVDGTLKIRGKTGDGVEVADSFAVKLAADRAAPQGRHAHLPRTWAAREIAALTTTQGDAAKKTIIDLSKRYTVLSRYTALLVLENDAMYREFNVVRNAGQTDSWAGGLAAPTGANAEASVRPESEPAAGATKDAPAKSADERPSTTASRRDSRSVAEDGESFDDDRLYPPPPREAQDIREPEPEAEAEAIDLVDEEEPAPAVMARPASPSSAPSRSAAPTSGASAKKGEKTSAAKPKRIPAPDNFPGDGFAGGLGSTGYGSGGGGYGRGMIARAPRLQIRDASPPSAKTLEKLADLRRQRDADPTSRKAHRRLVQASIYYGAAEAFDDARAWALADPDHAPALLAVADLLAARGEPIAHRAYASAADVRPFDRRIHRRLADSLLDKGEIVRACAHLRAIVSIDPKKPEHHADLARCLAQAGRWDLAEEAVAGAAGRATGDTKALRRVAAELQERSLTPPTPGRLHGRADLRATLTWSGDADFDIAVVDARGRRLSALRRELVLVREGRGEESLSLRKVDKPVFIEVSRRAPAIGEAARPASANLRIKAGGVSRTFEITGDQTTLRLAKVSWRR